MADQQGEFVPWDEKAFKENLAQWGIFDDDVQPGATDPEQIDPEQIDPDQIDPDPSTRDAQAGAKRSLNDSSEPRSATAPRQVSQPRFAPPSIPQGRPGDSMAPVHASNCKDVPSLGSLQPPPQVPASSLQRLPAQHGGPFPRLQPGLASTAPLQPLALSSRSDTNAMAAATSALPGQSLLKMPGAARPPEVPIVANLFMEVSAPTLVHGSVEDVELLREATEQRQLAVPMDVSDFTHIMQSLAFQLGTSPNRFYEAYQSITAAGYSPPKFAGLPLPFVDGSLDVDQVLRSIWALRFQLEDRERVGQLVVVTIDPENRKHVQRVQLWEDAPATDTAYLCREITKDEGGYHEVWLAFEARPPPATQASNSEINEAHQEPQPPKKAKGKAKKLTPKRTPVKRFHGMMRTPADFQGYDKLTAEQLMDPQNTVPSNHFMGETILTIGMEYRNKEIAEEINHRRVEEGSSRKEAHKLENVVKQRIRHALIARAEALGYAEDSREAIQIRTDYTAARYNDRGSRRHAYHQATIGKRPQHKTPRSARKLKVRRKNKSAANDAAEDSSNDEEQDEVADDEQGHGMADVADAEGGAPGEAISSEDDDAQQGAQAGDDGNEDKSSEAGDAFGNGEGAKGMDEIDHEDETDLDQEELDYDDELDAEGDTDPEFE